MQISWDYVTRALAAGVLLVAYMIPLGSTQIYPFKVVKNPIYYRHMHNINEKLAKAINHRHVGSCPSPENGGGEQLLPAFRVMIKQIIGCMNLCHTDIDCIEREKCCDSGCGLTCTKAIVVKPGQCPLQYLTRRRQVDPVPECVETGEHNKERDECQDDQECAGAKKCCLHSCRKHCMKAEHKPGYIHS